MYAKVQKIKHVITLKIYRKDGIVYGNIWKYSKQKVYKYMEIYRKYGRIQKYMGNYSA